MRGRNDQSSDERGAELRELFFETAQELLQSLNEEALKLEKNPGDEETVRTIRRTVHTLKGDAAACGLRELSELAHQLEDALALEARRAMGRWPKSPLLPRTSLPECSQPTTAGARCPLPKPWKRIDELTAAPAAKKARRKKKSAPGPQPGANWTDAEKRSVAKAKGSGLALYEIVVKIDLHCTMPIAARQLIQNAISGIGQASGGAARCEVAGRLQAG